jgi:Spy/CpxP family protein refolding chaperone
MRFAGWGLLLAALVAMPACDDKGGEATPTPASGAPASTANAAAAASASAAAAASASAAAAAEKEKAENAAAAAEQDKATQHLHSHHRHHHHGGIAMFIDMAVDSLGLPADKKAQVEKIQADLHAKMAPSRDAEHAVLQLLADGVAAGKIDDAKLDAALKKQEAASAAIHAANADALNQLHDALSPAERAALVDKVKAHAEVWKKVNHDEEQGSKEKGGHLAHLTEMLSLTPDQAEKISAALQKDAPPKPDLAAVDAHIKAFEAAFEADKFDAKTLTTANAANSAISKHGSARMVRFYKIVTPLLTPEQRTKLAEHIRERMNDPHAAK